jgi:hypothetical protein
MMANGLVARCCGSVLMVGGCSVASGAADSPGNRAAVPMQGAAGIGGGAVAAGGWMGGVALPSTLPVALPALDSGTGGACRAGHYVGTFAGKYRTAIFANGDVPIDFATMAVNGRPGFEFWLVQADAPCVPGNEFCVGAVVKGGKVRGNATPFVDPNASMPQNSGFAVRFEINLTGELDCNTGEFHGRLDNGCWDVFGSLIRFAGTIDGTYALDQSAFTTGVWHVDEMMMADAAMPTSPLGGDGMWSAAFMDESDAPVAGIGLCDHDSGFDTQL